MVNRVTSAAEQLRAAVDPLRFPEPVDRVYNPLDYAWQAHAAYCERFANGTKKVIFLGMNPGPFGMAQTGVPFGEVSMVRDWIGIEAPVKRPANEHPKRPVDGFACTRSEVSGRRLWGYFAERFGTPETFFADHFVANYCPLIFMSASARNITPDKLPTDAVAKLYAICDRHVQQLVDALKPAWVIGVGAFAEQRASAALEGDAVRIGRILHPSPASPAANRGWAEQAERQLRELAIFSG